MTPTSTTGGRRVVTIGCSLADEPRSMTGEYESLCTRAIAPTDARPHVTAHGAAELTDALLTIVSIID